MFMWYSWYLPGFEASEANMGTHWHLNVAFGISIWVSFGVSLKTTRKKYIPPISKLKAFVRGDVVFGFSLSFYSVFVHRVLQGPPED